MLQLVKPPDRNWTESLELLGQTNEAPNTTGWVAGHTSAPYLTPLLPNEQRTIITPIFWGCSRRTTCSPAASP